MGENIGHIICLLGDAQDYKNDCKGRVNAHFVAKVAQCQLKLG